MISVENISVDLGGNGNGKVRILNDISLQVKKGTITVIIGPSGSGKSTLLKSMSLLINPTSGIIQIEDKRYNFPVTKNHEFREQFKRKDNKQKVGVVFQDLHLIPHWTNYENIIKPLKKVTKEQKEKLDFFIELFQMQNFIYSYPGNSSKGEEQRTALIRAIMMNPDFLFLDEITSALDPEQIVEVLKYCLSLKDEGKAIIIVTHYIPFAQKAADQIIFMDKGQIVERGDNTIISSPKSERLKTFIDSLRYIVGTTNKN
jgi:L-cystine transport system ATP-binding protein